MKEYTVIERPTTMLNAVDLMRLMWHTQPASISPSHMHTALLLCTLIYFYCLLLYSSSAASSPHTPVSFSCAPVPVLCSSPRPLPSPPFWPLWHSVPFSTVLCWLMKAATAAWGAVWGLCFVLLCCGGGVVLVVVVLQCCWWLRWCELY